MSPSSFFLQTNTTRRRFVVVMAGAVDINSCGSADASTVAQEVSYTLYHSYSHSHTFKLWSAGISRHQYHITNIVYMFPSSFFLQLWSAGVRIISIGIDTTSLSDAVRMLASNPVATHALALPTNAAPAVAAATASVVAAIVSDEGGHQPVSTGSHCTIHCRRCSEICKITPRNVRHEKFHTEAFGPRPSTFDVIRDTVTHYAELHLNISI
jgi:hypothetical protein